MDQAGKLLIRSGLDSADFVILHPDAGPCRSAVTVPAEVAKQKRKL